MKSTDLITYCGGYGGHCARYIGYTAFREAAALLAELVDSHGYQYWLPSEVKEFDYNESRKGLDFFRRGDSWLVCKGCCKGGGGGPPGCVRDCCIKHNIDVCFECGEFPCDRVKDNVRMLKRAEDYRKLGREEWLRRAEDKARKGFEGHTGKYYRVWASESPLKD